MDDADLTVSLVTVGDPGQLTGGYLYHRRMAQAAPPLGARVRFVSFPSWRFPLPALLAPALRRALHGSDVVLLDSIAAAYLAPLRTLDLPLVAIAHQPPGGIDHATGRRRLQARLDVAVYRRVRRLLVASDALAEAFSGVVPDALVRVVAPGCDVGVPEGPPVDLRQGRRAALLSVGNWVPRKGLLALLDAVARLPAGAATLHLVGRRDVDAAYTRRVQERLRAPDLAGRVRVHGPVSKERVATLYRSADVFVLPSLREPFGTVYAEAMAAGLPVVGWRAGNLPHLAADGREGLIVAPGDVGALAAALARLADDDGLRRRLAAAARRRAATFPTWDQTAERLFSELRDVARESVSRGDGAR